jgi:transcription initiation factor TFIIE subunit beta
MSSYLQKSQEAFKSNVISASSKVSNKRTLAPPPVSAPSPAPSNASSIGGDTSKDQKRKREPQNVVYSQPEATGYGSDLLTQITYIIEFLKKKNDAKTFQEILQYLSKTNALEREKRVMAGILRKHGSIEWIPDPKAKVQNWDSGTFRHRPKIAVRNKTELLQYLQQKPDARGVSVIDLKDGWPDCEDPIRELEEAHQLLVTRTKKDNHARMVWANDRTLVHKVDDEFNVMWHKTELPAPDDLVRKLIDAGQKPASEDPAKRIKAAVKPKIKQKRPPRFDCCARCPVMLADNLVERVAEPPILTWSIFCVIMTI